MIAQQLYIYIYIILKYNIKINISYKWLLFLKSCSKLSTNNNKSRLLLKISSSLLSPSHYIRLTNTQGSGLGLRRLNTSSRCRLETYSFPRTSYRAKIELWNDAPWTVQFDCVVPNLTAIQPDLEILLRYPPLDNISRSLTGVLSFQLRWPASLSNTE
jgi:hypothetical protein